MNHVSCLCKKASDYLEYFCLTGAVILLIINLSSVMLGVFARFYNPPIWTMDLAQITLVWTVMLAAAPALKRGEHMAITIIVDKLPQNFQNFVTYLRVIVYFIILFILIILGIQYAWNMRLFTIMSLDINKTIPLMAIPIGMGLMLIQYTLSQFIPLENKKNDTFCKNDLNKGKKS